MEFFRKLAVGSLVPAGLFLSVVIPASAATTCAPSDSTCINAGGEVSVSASYDGQSQTDCPAWDFIGLPALKVGPLLHQGEMKVSVGTPLGGDLEAAVPDGRSYTVTPSIPRYPLMQRQFVVQSGPKSASVVMIGMDSQSGGYSDQFHGCSYTDYSAFISGFLNKVRLGGGSSMIMSVSEGGGMSFCIPAVSCPSATLDWVLAQNFVSSNSTSVFKQAVGGGYGGVGGISSTEGNAGSIPGGSSEGSEVYFVPIYPVTIIQATFPGVEPFLIKRSYSCGRSTCQTAAFTAPNAPPFYYKEGIPPKTIPPAVQTSSGSWSQTWRMMSGSGSFGSTEETYNNQEYLTTRNHGYFYEMSGAFDLACSYVGNAYNGYFNAGRKQYYCATGDRPTPEGVNQIRDAIKSFGGYVEVQTASRGTLVGKIYTLTYKGTSIPPFRWPETYSASLFEDLMSWASGVAFTGSNVLTSNIYADGLGGVVVCEEGEPDCPSTQTHTECTIEGQCITVNGAGTNQCSSNANCSLPPPNTHTVCQGTQCVSVSGEGSNACLSNSDCKLIGPGCEVVVSSSPNPPNIGTSVRWEVKPVGGLFPSGYSYEWSGTDSLSGSSSIVSKTYPSGGVKSGFVIVKDATGAVVTSCSETTSVSAPVTLSCGAMGTLNDPAKINEEVKWWVNPIGGSGNYTYSWSGAVTGTQKEVLSYPSTPGIKFAVVSVRDTANPNVAIDCSASTSVYAEDFKLSCDVSPKVTTTGSDVVWTGTVSGGTGVYTYQWTGDEITAAAPADTANGNLTFTKRYVSSGEKIATVKVISGSESRSCYNKINVVPSGTFDYSISKPNDTSTIQGTPFSQPIHLKLLSGNTQPVDVTAINLPTGMTATFDWQESVTCSPSCGATLALDTTSVAPGTYPITIRGRSAGLADKTVSFNLTVKATDRPITGSCKADKTTVHSSSDANKEEYVLWTVENIDGGDGMYIYEWLDSSEWVDAHSVAGDYGGSTSGADYTVGGLRTAYYRPGTYSMRLSLTSGDLEQSVILNCGSVVATQANLIVKPLEVSGDGKVAGTVNTYLAGTDITVKTSVQNIGSEAVNERFQGSLFIEPTWLYWFDSINIVVPLQTDEYSTEYETAKRNSFLSIGAAGQSNDTIPVSVTIPGTTAPGLYRFKYCADTANGSDIFSVGSGSQRGYVDESDFNSVTPEVDGEYDNCSGDVEITISDADLGHIVVHAALPKDKYSLVRLNNSGVSDLIEGTKIYNVSSGSHTISLMEINDYTLGTTAKIKTCDDVNGSIGCSTESTITTSAVSTTEGGTSATYRRANLSVSTNKYTHVYYTYATVVDYSLSNGGNKTVNQGSSVTNTITATQTSGAASVFKITPEITSIKLGTTKITPTESNGTLTFGGVTVNVPGEIGVNGGVSTLTFTASPTATLGTYTITATGTPLSQTPNNDGTTFTLTVGAPPKPDLTAYQPSITGTQVWNQPGTYAASQPVTIAGVIKNTNAATTKSFYGSFFSGSTSIKDDLIVGLGANAERTVTDTRTLTAGTYPRTLCADKIPSEGVVDEVLETNNCSSTVVNIVTSNTGHIKMQTSGAVPTGGGLFQLDGVVVSSITNYVLAGSHTAGASAGSSVVEVSVNRGCNSSFTSCTSSDLGLISRNDSYARTSVSVGANEYVLVTFSYAGDPEGGPSVDLKVKTRQSASYSDSISIRAGQTVDFSWTSSDMSASDTVCSATTPLGSFSGSGLPHSGTRLGDEVSQGKSFQITCTDSSDSLNPVTFTDTAEVRVQPIFREF